LGNPKGDVLMFKGIHFFNGRSSIRSGNAVKVTLSTAKSAPQKGLWLLIICCIALPLYRILPTWVAWESNILENAQAIVLLGGFLIALHFAYVDNHNQWRKFWSAMAPFWLVLFGREINWGRVFLAPTGFGSIHGPNFPPLSSLWYSPVVKPLVALCLLGGGYLFFKYRGYLMLFQLFHQKRFPILEMTIAIVAIAASPLAEHDCFHFLGERCELMEELLELISYLGLFITQLDVFFQTKRD
jgi:hypothetical protein